jgi:hypothetical protein
MWWFVVRLLVAAAMIAGIAEISQKLPRVGALLLSLPIISILAFVLSWQQHRDLAAVCRMAKETLVLVPLGLPFFVSLALAQRTGLGFYPSLAIGLVLASLAISLWMCFAPRIGC